MDDLNLTEPLGQVSASEAGVIFRKDQLAVVALGITAEGFKFVLDFEPVSYTHLTLPTKA